MKYKVRIQDLWPKAIAFIAFVLLLFSFYENVKIVDCHQLTEDGAIARITVFATIANGLLLYATLKSQTIGINNQREAVVRERFETTFFNLLKSLRDQANDISVVRNDYDTNSMNIVTKQYEGKQFFKFANSEISRIFTYIYSPEMKDNVDMDYLLTMQANATTEEEERLYRNKIGEENKQRIQVAFYDLKDVDGKEDIEPFTAYRKFADKFKEHYEQYERSLTYILNFINDSGLDSSKYVDILYSQMSRDEADFVSYLFHDNEQLLTAASNTGLFVRLGSKAGQIRQKPSIPYFK